MRVKITDATTNMRYVSYDEIGIRDHIDNKRVDNMWVYDIVDEQLFFLAVIKYGISYQKV